jgi:hypothetical protein
MSKTEGPPRAHAYVDALAAHFAKLGRDRDAC